MYSGYSARIRCTSRWSRRSRSSMSDGIRERARRPYWCAASPESARARPGKPRALENQGRCRSAGGAGVALSAVPALFQRSSSALDFLPSPLRRLDLRVHVVAELRAVRPADSAHDAAHHVIAVRLRVLEAVKVADRDAGNE